MPIPDVIKDMQHRMHGAIEALHAQFKTLRTGRANAAMLDGVIVDYYGTPTPLAQARQLKVPEAVADRAEPWDKSMVGADRESHPQRRPRPQSSHRRQGHPHPDSACSPRSGARIW